MSPNVIWTPNSGPQEALISCPVFEVFFGGARGGGKTEGSIGDWLQHSNKYGEAAIGAFYRRTFKQLEEVVARTQEIFPQIGAKWNEQKATWTMPGGGRLKFRYLERDKDVEESMGHSNSRVYIEELCNFPSPGPINKLKATLRSGKGVPCCIRLTGNPGGPGHQWVKKRYIDPAPGGWKIIAETYVHPVTGADIVRERVFIPSRVHDNPKIGDDYVGNLNEAARGNPALLKAWLDGNWDIVQGAFFEGFDANLHVVPTAKLMKAMPQTATRFRSFDWGFAKPFSCGWYVVCDGKWGIDGKLFPRDALIKYREWYGCTGEPDVGLRMNAEMVARGILAKEALFDERIEYGVADPSIYIHSAGPSIMETMAQVGLFWRKADNKRVPGWQEMQRRLMGTTAGRVVPLLYFADCCEDSIRTIPTLLAKEDDPEDLDTESEDHAADECFIAGTLIDTPNGRVPIEKMAVGDLVITRQGSMLVDAVFSVGERETLRVELSNGESLIGTANHPVWVEEKGFIPLSALRYADMMRSCPIQTNTVASPAKFGVKFMAQFRRVASFITLMVTSAIMRRAICNVLRPQSIGVFTRTVRRAFLRFASNAALSIKSWSPLPTTRVSVATLASRHGGAIQVLTMSNASALHAANRLWLTAIGEKAHTHIAQELAVVSANTSGLKQNTPARNAAFTSLPRTVAQSGVQPSVVSVTTAGRQRVYNLTVRTAEEYFASGVLVHNCRYACCSRPTTIDSDAEEYSFKYPKLPQEKTINELIAERTARRVREEA